MARALVVTLVLAAALGVAACGDDGAEPDGAVTGGDAAHVHGLGVNPADDALYVATHTGLFRAPDGQSRASRVGDRRQDTMGFTVAGPDLFLGSGHPDMRDDLPSHLGLIRSEDRGRSWTPVSLLGEADFHVLRAARRTVYGFDATSGRLLASGDAGATWQQRRIPAPLVDLAIDPDDPRHLVASAPDGLYESPDGGRGWRPHRTAPPGLLAWTDALVLIDGEGRVHRSQDAGRTLDQVGDLGGQPAALAAHGTDLYAATHDNVVKVSRDGGATWTVRARV